ncbi:MAG: GTP cyclohydrolase II [Candidatus Heimdallarchaeota archaeon]|nr:GTP cyclohydrolase II [Candidatus Heimdallarchaeota archaeon]MDH5645733.1 GTP cyclohydrolase II [Candidatus Heimdallarchaeota archaeon]
MVAKLSLFILETIITTRECVNHMIIPDNFTSLISEDTQHICPENEFCVKIVAITKLPTKHGLFYAIAFDQTHDSFEHVVFAYGDVVNKEEVLVRLHSECLTGDTIGSLRCDCGQQLNGSLSKIVEEGAGILIYLRQEGRGIGLVNKLKAYALQDNGLNTFEANRALGFKDDERNYLLAAHILKSLKVHSIRLLTNNPEKIKSLEENGIKVTKRMPLQYKSNKHNESYLRSKFEQNHLLEIDWAKDHQME